MPSFLRSSAPWAGSMFHILAAGALGGIIPKAKIANDTLAPAPPALAPPCEVLVLTFYNPCKCDWDKFHAFMSGMLTQPAATDVNGTTHAFDAQAAAGCVRVPLMKAWNLSQSHLHGL